MTPRAMTSRAIAPPPARSRLRQFLWSCVSSPGNIALTLLFGLLLALTLPGFVEWALIEGRWTGAGAEACRDPAGACWVFIEARLGQLVYGDYPPSQHWRVDLVFAITAVSVFAVTLRAVRRRKAMACAVLFGGPALALLVMLGGGLGLPLVPTTRWGGLALTVIVASTTLAGALPLGLLLALGRRGTLPVLRWFAIATIEFWRGIPLLAVLFLVMAVLPLLLPPGLDIPPLTRALAAFILFNAAGMAEVFRGGLQAIPEQQIENAKSLGLTPFRILTLIELPQAIALATPGLINTAIAVVKETTVILIIGLMDFLAQIQAGLADPQWIIGDQVRDAAYVFAGLVFWAVCFALSRVSARLERSKEQRASR